MKGKKKSLILSGAMLIVCFVLLIGTTFAWFTDSITNSNNRIQAGSLDVKLYQFDGTGYKEITDSSDPVFANDILEPGSSEVAVFKILNDGALTFRYRMDFVASQAGKLVDVIEVYTYRSADPITKLPESVTEEGYAKAGTLAEFMLAEDGAVNGVLAAQEESYVGIILYLPTSVGAEYNGALAAEFDIVLRATQVDENAAYDDIPYTGIKERVEETVDVVQDGDTVVNYLDMVKVSVPADAVADQSGQLTLTVEPKLPTAKPDGIVVEAAESVQVYEISATNIKDDNTAEISVELFVGKDLANVKLYHNSDEIAYESYDSATGMLVFKTASFSPFTVVASNIAYVSDAASLVKAAANGGYVMLTQDIDVAQAVTVTLDTVLDLNGKTLASSVSAVVAKNGATLTICGDGTVRGGTGGSYTAVTASGASVVIENGTFSVGSDENNEGNSCIYAANGGTVEINGGHFSTDAAWHDFYYVLNCQNKTGSDIDVTGGTFVNYNPAVGDDYEQPTCFLAKNSASVKTDNVYTVMPIMDAVNHGGEIYTGELEITEDTLAARLIFRKDSVLNLMGNVTLRTGNGDANWCAFLIAGCEVTVNAADSIVMDTYSKTGAYGFNVLNAGKLTINGGTYKGFPTAAQVQLGALVINGGIYECYPDDVVKDDLYRYTVNCIDDAYKGGTAKVEICGGTFYQYNPGDNLAEGKGTNFLGVNYVSVQEGDYYTVYGVEEGITKGGNITVGELDITKTAREDRMIIDTDASLYLVGNITMKPESETENYFVFTIGSGANVTVNAAENVTIDACGQPAAYCFNVNGGTLTINGGTFIGAPTAAQVQSGSLVINGGKYKCYPTEMTDSVKDDLYRYTINCIDSAYRDGTATVEIYGGEFYEFNPCNNQAEGKGTSFLGADSKIMVKEADDGTWYKAVAADVTASDGWTDYAAE